MKLEKSVFTLCVFEMECSLAGVSYRAHVHAVCMWGFLRVLLFPRKSVTKDGFGSAEQPLGVNVFTYMCVVYCDTPRPPEIIHYYPDRINKAFAGDEE